MKSRSYSNLCGLGTEELFIAVYLWVERAVGVLERELGPFRQCAQALKPAFTDAEVLCCMIVGEMKGNVSERSWHAELATTFKTLFPDLPSWSQYKRRGADCGRLMELTRRWLIEHTCADHGPQRLVDTQPIPLAHLQRARYDSNRRFRPTFLGDRFADPRWKVAVEAGLADIGYCASKKEYYFGMKLHLICTPERVPMAWSLTPASQDDRAGLWDLVEEDPLVLKGGWINIFADKGYISSPLADELWKEGHDLQALPKVSSLQPWPREVRRLVSGARQQVETVFAEATRFLAIDKMRPASLGGLLSRVAAKIMVITLHSLSHLLLDIANGKM